jgi:integrase
MELNVARLTTSSPILGGDGFISVVDAASAIGLPVRAFLTELGADGVEFWAAAGSWAGWRVDDYLTIDQEDNGGFVLNDVEATGHRIELTGFARAFHRSAVFAQLLETGESASTSVFRQAGRVVFFTDSEQLIGVGSWLLQKGDVERIRERLARGVPPEAKQPARAPEKPVCEGVVITDAITVKHGHKRFSELFSLCRNHRQWSKVQSDRMETEAGLFIELMDDPTLSSIEVETIHEFARRLSRLPNDIYQSRRRFKVESLHDLIAIAEREGLLRKKAATVKGHVGRIAEVLNYAVTKGMMHANPAAGFKREWGLSKNKRPQDSRDIFTPEELDLIFSQDWFVDGTGAFAAKGSTNWRPHYFWLPLLALTSGGRLNELSQLYLDDVRPSTANDSSVWVLDFNLDQPDKIDNDEDDGDEDDEVADKSLKTVNAIRVVPLHDVVIRAGLPEYVAALRKAGHTRLFPELKRDDMKGYGKPVGSWFNERFLGRRLKMERNGKKTFHSFRHCFLTALERLDQTERVQFQLGGHQRGSGESGTRYTKDRTAEELKPIIDRLNFSCLADIGRFDCEAGLRAIKVAMGLKRQS